MSRLKDRADDRHNRLVELWLHGDVGPDGEQLALPGMPEPPTAATARMMPFLLNFYATGKNGRDIRPGYKRLMRVTGLSRSTLQRIVKELLAADLYVIAGDKPTSGRGNTLELVENFPDWSPIKGVTSDLVSDQKPSQKSPEKVSPMTPHQSSPSEKTATSSARFQSARAATSNEPAPEPTATVPPAAPEPSPIAEELSNEEPGPVDHKSGRDAAVRAIIENRFAGEDFTDPRTRARFIVALERAGLIRTDDERAEQARLLDHMYPVIHAANDVVSEVPAQ